MLIRSLLSNVSHFPLLPFAGEDGAGKGAPGSTPPAGDPPAGDPPASGAGGDPPADDGGTGDAGEDDGAGGAGGDGDGTGGDGAGDGTPPAAGAAPVTDWRDREISRKHRQLQDERRERERLSRELEDAQALLARQPPAGDPPAGGATPPAARPAAADPDAVQREARKIVARQDYDKQCNDTYESGKLLYKDKWDDTLKRLDVLGGLGEGQDGFETMTSVLATDNPSQVLYALGSNPDEYHRVMALPPAKRMAEIVKLGITKPKVAPKPSDVPEPVEPIARRAKTSDPEPQDSDDDPTWYAKRARQKAARFAARQGRSASA